MNRKLRFLALLMPLILTLSELDGQARIGRAISAQGTAERRPDAAPAQDWMRLRSRGPVELADTLRTLINSKLGVLLVLGGHHLVIGEDVEVLVQVEGTAQTPVVVLQLQKGSLRVVTGTAGFPVVTRTEPGEARSDGTGYIVHCGPPDFPDPATCLFLGVYSQTQVSSFAPGTASVVLSPRFFTIVRPGQGPTAPVRMEDSRFRAFLDRTTILGTGSEDDRLLPGRVPEPPEFGFDIPRRHRPSETEPEGRVPVDPRPPDQLPDPPEPPRPPNERP